MEKTRIHKKGKSPQEDNKMFEEANKCHIKTPEGCEKIANGHRRTANNRMQEAFMEKQRGNGKTAGDLSKD